MKEKIIQGGIVNGEKMLVCPTWEDEFQKAINSTGGCFRISMDYSAVDVSWWKELEAIAKKYGYTLDSESLEIIQEYVQKYKKYENHFWEYGKKIITFEQFSRMLSKKAGIQPKEAKDYVAANLQNLEHKEIWRHCCSRCSLLNPKRDWRERSGQNRRAILLRKNLRR